MAWEIHSGKWSTSFCFHSPVSHLLCIWELNMIVYIPKKHFSTNWRQSCTQNMLIHVIFSSLPAWFSIWSFFPSFSFYHLLYGMLKNRVENGKKYICSRPFYIGFNQKTRSSTFLYFLTWRFNWSILYYKSENATVDTGQVCQKIQVSEFKISVGKIHNTSSISYFLSTKVLFFCFLLAVVDSVS